MAEGTPPVEHTWSSYTKTLVGHWCPIDAVAFPQEGKLIASGSGDNTNRMSDAATDDFKKALVSHLRWVTGVAFSLDSKLIAPGSQVGPIKVWDIIISELNPTLAGYSWENEHVAT